MFIKTENHFPILRRYFFSIEKKKEIKNIINDDVLFNIFLFVHFLSPFILYQKENILCIKVENRLTIDFKDRSRKKGIISVICFTSDVSLFDLQATYRSCLRLTIRVLRGRNITVGGLEGMSKYLINICACSK